MEWSIEVSNSINKMADYISEKIREAGFEKVDDFVREHLHYLPNSNKRIFYKLKKLETQEFQNYYASTSQNYSR